MPVRVDPFAEQLVAVFRRIRKMPYFRLSHGDSFAKTATAILEHDARLREIPASEWKTDERYKNLRKQIHEYDFSSTEFFGERLIVKEPNGTQKFPDAIILHNGCILAFEFKTNKKDHILWNGGLPRAGAIYFFNGGGRGKTEGTTSFLGQHVITMETHGCLEIIHVIVKLVVDILNDKLGMRFWSYFARKAHNNSFKYLESSDRLKRETECDSYVRALFSADKTQHGSSVAKSTLAATISSEGPTLRATILMLARQLLIYIGVNELERALSQSPDFADGAKNVAVPEVLAGRGRNEHQAPQNPARYI